MKRLIAILCILATTVFICGCGKTSVNQKADVTLTFIREGVDIRITLPEDEAEQVRNILDGNRYDPVLSGIPACGFDSMKEIRGSSQLSGTRMSEFRRMKYSASTSFKARLYPPVKP